MVFFPRVLPSMFVNTCSNGKKSQFLNYIVLFTWFTYLQHVADFPHTSHVPSACHLCISLTSSSSTARGIFSPQQQGVCVCVWNSRKTSQNCSEFGAQPGSTSVNLTFPICKVGIQEVIYVQKCHAYSMNLVILLFNYTIMYNYFLLLLGFNIIIKKMISPKVKNAQKTFPQKEDTQMTDKHMKKCISKLQMPLCTNRWLSCQERRRK